MTVVEHLAKSEARSEAVAALLERVLDTPAFEDVTAREITHLSDALDAVLAGEHEKTASTPAFWTGQGFGEPRAAAIVDVLRPHLTQAAPDAPDPASANDNAENKSKPKQHKKVGGEDMAGRSKTAAAQEPTETGEGIAELDALLDAIEACVLVVDRSYSILSINRACQDELETLSAQFEAEIGIAVDDLVGSSLLDLMGDAAAARRKLKRVGTHTVVSSVKLGTVELAMRINRAGLAAAGFDGMLVTLGFKQTDVDGQDGPDVAGGNGMRVRLAASAEELLSVSQRLAQTAEEASSQANLVSAASEQVSQNLQTVAGGMEELSHSIAEIARSASEASSVAATGVDLAETTNHTVAKLGESSSEIGKVIKVITTIAQQTNLLALNATIEAARAGDAGKGFAVVANEVKDLAKETATASEDISRKVEAIQSGTAGAVAAISEINNIVNQINEIQLNIASAVEQQTATAGEIGRNIGEAARGSAEITESIVAVATAARSTSEGAMDTKRAAEDLNRLASQWDKA